MDKAILDAIKFMRIWGNTNTNLLEKKTLIFQTIQVMLEKKNPQVVNKPTYFYHCFFL
jgi:hypothetical protein